MFAFNTSEPPRANSRNCHDANRPRSPTVDAYPAAARAFRGCESGELPWNHKIEEPGVMDLISVAQVTAKLDELLGQG